MHGRAETNEPKNIRLLWSHALTICALVAAGCGQQQQKPNAGPAAFSDIGTAEAMEVAEDVLAAMRFAIEKADVSSGYIRTRPLAGAQFFEFWRSDNVGAENALLANLHTIRRTVELNITGRDGQLEIDCHVRVQRLSVPEREVISTARAYGMYTTSSPVLQKIRFDPEQIKGVAWIDLDEDEKLATKIVKRIREQITGRTSDESQSAESRT